jgi:parallel beta-helix repeat protein
MGAVSDATLTVCSSGCGYTTIQSAIDASTAGDTIEVGAGTYNENILIEGKAINLLGADKTTTRINGVGSASAVHAVVNVKDTGSSSSPVSIKGFTIDATFDNSYVGEGEGDGVYILNSNYVTVEQNNIINSRDCGVLIGYNSNNNVIKKNTITGSADGSNSAVYIYDSESNMIGGNDASEGNTISSATSTTVHQNLNDALPLLYLYGVRLSNAPSTNLRNNKIQYNTIVGGDRGVQIDSDIDITGTTINNNEIYNVAGYAAVVINGGSIGATIKNNNIHDNDAGGMAINAQIVEFSENSIFNNDFGVEMGATGVTFVLHNNKIVGNDPEGTACSNPNYGVCPGTGLSVYLGSADATNNYWGTNVESEIAAKVSANVDYNPWYTDETLTTLSNGDSNVGGYGGDFVALTVPDYINYGTLYGFDGFQSQEKIITLNNTGTLNIDITPVWSSGHDIFKYIRFREDISSNEGWITSDISHDEGEGGFFTTSVIADNCVVDEFDELSCNNQLDLTTWIYLDEDKRPLKGALSGTIYFNAVETA